MTSGLTINQTNSLTGSRKRNTYNAAEQRFSLILQQRLQELLEGRRNALTLLRKYPEQPDRLGVIVTPPDLPRDELRLPVVEAMTWETVNFICTGAPGGPVSQQQTADGTIVELQIFATRFPHIVIERTDRFPGDGEDPVDVTWCLRRVQNQRAQTQLNRLLDATNLALELLRAVR